MDIDVDTRCGHCSLTDDGWSKGARDFQAAEAFVAAGRLAGAGPGRDVSGGPGPPAVSAARALLRGRRGAHVAGPGTRHHGGAAQQHLQLLHPAGPQVRVL